MNAKPKPSYAPVYAAALYPQLATIAKEHGYALAVHGSLQRDFDVIAIPWTEAPSTPEDVIAAFTGRFAIEEVGYSDKPHGRRAWSLSIGFGECAIDLSFMPLRELPLACGECEGRGRVRGEIRNEADYGDQACEACDGTGTAPTHPSPAPQEET